MYDDYTLAAIAVGLLGNIAVLATLLVQELAYQKLVSYKKHGGLRFVTLGRLCFSFCVKRA